MTSDLQHQKNEMKFWELFTAIGVKGYRNWVTKSGREILGSSDGICAHTSDSQLKLASTEEHAHLLPFHFRLILKPNFIDLNMVLGLNINQGIQGISETPRERVNSKYKLNYFNLDGKELLGNFCRQVSFLFLFCCKTFKPSTNVIMDQLVWNTNRTLIIQIAFTQNIPSISSLITFVIDNSKSIVAALIRVTGRKSRQFE